VCKIFLIIVANFFPVASPVSLPKSHLFDRPILLHPWTFMFPLQSFESRWNTVSYTKVIVKSRSVQIILQFYFCDRRLSRLIILSQIVRRLPWILLTVVASHDRRAWGSTLNFTIVLIMVNQHSMAPGLIQVTLIFTKNQLHATD